MNRSPLSTSADVSTCITAGEDGTGEKVWLDVEVGEGDDRASISDGWVSLRDVD